MYSVIHDGTTGPRRRWPFARTSRAILLMALAVAWLGAARVYADECTDGDGDGYGTGADCLGPDCDDGNSQVHPGAVEVCNGIDDDCDGQTDEGLMLAPDDSVPVFGFETRGECSETGGDCDLRDPLPEGCGICVAKTHNFNQVVQACVDGGAITGPCDDGNPEAEGSLAEGNACETGGTCQPVAVALGEPCVEGAGVCRRLGTVVCAANQVVCDAVPGPKEVDVEGSPEPQSNPLCFDEQDNDCDGEVDHEDFECRTDEICDGFDNDFVNGIDDGFPLGEECTVGPPGTPCANTGIYICSEAGGVKCNLNAHPPGEIPEASCGDGVDNDCDGFTDCNDSDCVKPELCDGKDNDCDGSVDENFPTLTDPCAVGVGACYAAGQVVCNTDKTGTMCNAVPLASSPERRTAGSSCSDGVDNDCDGLTDDEEGDCAVSGLTVACSLMYDGPPPKRFSTTKDGRGEPGADCQGWHVPVWRTTGAVGEVTCTAVLKGLDPEGAILGALPVSMYERAHLNSRLDPLDFKMVTRSNKSRGVWHEVFAPIPLLEVTCRDDAATAKAYCSNVPWLEVVEPNGSVVSASAGDEISVLAAIPRVDPRTIKVLIDCVDIIPQLVLDPATQLPGGPFGGPVDIDGKTIQIEDLFVRAPDPDTESSVEDLGANTVTMTVVGAGCGGHAIVVDGERAADFIRPPLTQLTPQCHMDDAKDSGEWSVFQITITTPAEGEIVDNAGSRPSEINVVGEVCHGQDIEEVLINGYVATLPEPTIIDGGEGECAGDSKTVTIDINEHVPVTDVAAVFAGTQSTRGSFDPGPNKLIAQATDIIGNTTHDLVPFVVGPAIAMPASVASVLEGMVANGGGLSIPKAFTLVLDDTVTLDSGNRAFREFFDQMIEEFSLNFANCLLQPRELCCEKELEMPWWTCNPDVTFCTMPQLTQTPEQFAETFDISVTPHDGYVTIRVAIPAFNLNVGAHGNCCTGGCGFFCVARTKVNFDGVMTIPNIAVEIDLDEADILQQDGKYTLRFYPGDDDNIGISGNTESAIKTGCGLFSVGTLIDVLTFGLSAIPRAVFNSLSAILGFLAEHHGIDLCPFVREIGGGDGMRNTSDDLTLGRDDLGADFGMALEHSIDAVEITPNGLAIAIGVTIVPTVVDPQADPLSGTMQTEAPLVLPGSAGTAEMRSLSVAIADDFWNQLLAAMVQSGKLRANFTKVLKLSEYIPSCSEITDDRRRARCIGTTECDPEDFTTLPVLGEVCTVCIDTFPSCLGDNDLTCPRRICNRAATRARDTAINRNTDIVLHARAENPPAFYLDDDPNTELVEIIFRTGELRAALIANRDGNNDVAGLSLGEGTCDEDAPCDPENKCDQGDLDQLDLDTAVADCSLDSLAANVDCLLWSTCLDLDIKFAVGVTSVDVGGVQRPELCFEMIGIVEPPPGQVAEDQGDQCGGSEEIPDLDFLNTESMRNDARRGVERSFCENTPPFQAEALDFGGVVEFLNPGLLTVSNCADASVCDMDFADYLVITGDLRSKGLGGLIADKVCEKIETKISEHTGACPEDEDDDDEDREKICP